MSSGNGNLELYWNGQAEGLEPWALVGSGWNNVYDTTTLVTIFSA